MTENYYQHIQRVYEERAAKSLPQTIKPDLANINKNIGRICKTRNMLNEYHCYELDRVAYWHANPQKHSDPVFIAACASNNGDPGKSAKRDVRYHVSILMRRDYSYEEMKDAVRDFGAKK